jgi:hypothetical protein
MASRDFGPEAADSNFRIHRPRQLPDGGMSKTGEGQTLHDDKNSSQGMLLGMFTKKSRQRKTNSPPMALHGILTDKVSPGAIGSSVARHRNLRIQQESLNKCG